MYIPGHVEGLFLKVAQMEALWGKSLVKRRVCCAEYVLKLMYTCI